MVINLTIREMRRHATTALADALGEADAPTVPPPHLDSALLTYALDFVLSAKREEREVHKVIMDLRRSIADEHSIALSLSDVKEFVGRIYTMH